MVYEHVICDIDIDNIKGEWSCIGIEFLCVIEVKLVSVQISLLSGLDFICNPHGNLQENICRMYTKGNEKSVKKCHYKNSN